MDYLTLSLTIFSTMLDFVNMDMLALAILFVFVRESTMYSLKSRNGLLGSTECLGC